MMFRRSQGAVALLTKIVGLMAIAFVGGVASGVFLIQPGTYRGSSATQAEEALELSHQYVWVDQSGWVEAAIVVLNTGERDASIRKLAVRGTECAWGDVYYWTTDTGPISDELDQTSVALAGASVAIVVDGVPRVFQPATGALTVRSGWTLVLYVRDPFDVLTLDEESITVAIAVFTVDNLYYKEAPVSGSSTTFVFMQTEELVFTSYEWGASNAYILVQVKNTGSASLAISEVRVNDVIAADDGITTPYTLVPGSTVTLSVTHIGGYMSGAKYEFKVVTTIGNTFGPYIRTAP